MDKKGWIIFGVIVVVLFGGLIILSQKNKIDVSGINVNVVTSASDKNGNIADHVFGKKDSKVVLIEYGDFQCPYCGNDYAGIKAVADKYQGQIAFVFRNLPLTTLHPNALAGASAAEAAGLQGKYWQMHDLLYENQDDWSNAASTSARTDKFAGYAEQLGLNVDKFKTDMSSDQVQKKIAFDRALFKKTGYEQSTPTLVLDGTKLADDIPSDQSKLDSTVAAELKKDNIALPDTAKKTTTKK